MKNTDLLQIIIYEAMRTIGTTDKELARQTVMNDYCVYIPEITDLPEPDSTYKGKLSRNKTLFKVAIAELAISSCGSIWELLKDNPFGGWYYDVRDALRERYGYKIRKKAFIATLQELRYKKVLIKHGRNFLLGWPLYENNSQRHNNQVI